MAINGYVTVVVKDHSFKQYPIPMFKCTKGFIFTLLKGYLKLLLYYLVVVLNIRPPYLFLPIYPLEQPTLPRFGVFIEASSLKFLAYPITAMVNILIRP